MNKGLLGCLMFAVGAITGSAATYFYMKNKAEKEIEDEVQKFKDDWIKDQRGTFYSRPMTEEESKVAIVSNPIENKTAERLRESAQKAIEAKDKPPITNYTVMYENIGGEKEMTIEDYMDKSGLIVDIPKNHPHVISEYEFTEEKEYDKYHYILFADGILADEDGEMVNCDEEGTENYIDPDVLYGFQMQDVTDELYYRNEEFERDFEILKSARFYKEE